jgi:hypothetical protein
MALGLWANGIEYVHQVDNQYEHIPASEFETARSILDLNADGDFATLSPADQTVGMLMYGWLKFLYIVQGWIPCEPNRVYVVDNCYWWIALQPAAFYNLEVKGKIRRIFSRSNKTHTIKFEASSTHVFVHLRQGDRSEASEGLLKYYIGAFKWISEHFSNCKFYIHSDDHKTPMYKNLLKEAGAEDLVESKGIAGVYEMMHRASMADILVLGNSKLAELCAALSPPGAIIFKSASGVKPINWTLA